MANWWNLTREDLRAFDEDQTKAILYAIEHGGVGRISNNGHAIIRNQNGQTMSVSRSASGGRRKQNVARDLVRLFGAPTEELAATGTEAAAPPPPLPLPPPAIDAPSLTCPVSSCDATFATEGARYQHVHAEHHPCREPGCGFVGATGKGESGHYRIVHQGARPAKGRRTPTMNKPVEKVPAMKRPVEDTPDIGTVHAEAEHYEQLPEAEGGAPKPEQPTDVERLSRAAEQVEAIREVLGEDPRIPVLQARVDRLERERDDALAQLALVREALRLA